MFNYILLIAFALFFEQVNCKKGFGPGEQDWGFAEVREGVHLFYWLYYADLDAGHHYTERPLIIWLQGGPGVSASYFANFNFVGPLDTSLNYRNGTWTKYVNVLFIDNPSDTGFSYVDFGWESPSNNYEIAISLVELMKIFYERHSDFIGIPVHIFGESYAGKFGVEFALEFYKAYQKNEIKSKIKTVDICNPFISVTDIIAEAPSAAYYMGAIDKMDKLKIEEKLNILSELIEAKQWAIALTYGVTVLPSFICGIIQGISIFSIDWIIHLDQKDVCGLGFLNATDADILMNGAVSDALNLENYKWKPFMGFVGAIELIPDIYKPVVHIVNELLTNTPIQVNVISGSYDLLVPTAATLRWMDKLEWDSRSDYDNAPRKAFYDEGILQGFEKIGKGLGMYWIERAGHMVASDNLPGLTYVLKKVSNID